MSPVEQDRQQVLYARGPYMAVLNDPCQVGRSSLVLTSLTESNISTVAEHNIASVFVSLEGHAWLSSVALAE